jgi:hypothetical protein
MGLEEVWKTLADLITEFRRKSETIPADVMEDLRAAKTLIHVLKAEPDHVENVPTIEAYLGNVESFLIMEAHEKFGSEFAENWMKKLREARKVVVKGRTLEPTLRFVPSLPRGKRWIRVQVSKETPQRYIESLADEFGLSYKMQRDGYMLVYGDDEKLKLFVKKTAKNLRSQEKE